VIIAKQQTETPELKERRIGLALSGGGFRASIFHLGVIRRLEELGIMQDVDVISAVSGGSIVAAYYVCEMERRLRLVPSEEESPNHRRVKIFEEIAEDFLKALDHNLRSRAIVFTPFYHPWLFVKTLFLKPFRAGARSELIQKEYDKWFYYGSTMDQLPCARAGTTKAGGLFGPKLLLNTTSLLTGKARVFSREPVSYVNEMSKVNDNVLPLSRVVGASSGVPGLFPPTTIAGDILVDGGVVDNQGIGTLMNDLSRCNLLIVSDASGQMEVRDSIGRGELPVLLRTNGILQFQVRNQILDILVGWKHLNPEVRFAFVHLFLNLKDRGAPNRVSSEYISAIGRIRTDLDQFSYVEREALMYHGYSLIDSQLKRYCKDKLEHIIDGVPMCTPPLFADEVQKQPEARNQIRQDLEAGSQSIFLFRSLKKFPGPVVPVLLLGSCAALSLVALILGTAPRILAWVHSVITGYIIGCVPTWFLRLADPLLLHLGLPSVSATITGFSGVAAVLFLIFLAGYCFLFPAFVVVRRIASTLDKRNYRRITGLDWSATWSQDGFGKDVYEAGQKRGSTELIPRRATSR
jgi:predicted acylesterase/phospholipase RssA